MFLRPMFAALLALSGVPAVAGAGPIPATAPVSQGAELLMVDRDGCYYCARWKAEILPGYAAAPEGRAAPLRMVQIDGPWPDGLALASRPAITPTFILLDGGREVQRLEGYPGARFFWPLLAEMLAKSGVEVRN